MIDDLADDKRQAADMMDDTGLTKKTDDKTTEEKLGEQKMKEVKEVATCQTGGWGSALAPPLLRGNLLVQLLV